MCSKLRFAKATAKLREKAKKYEALTATFAQTIVAVFSQKFIQCSAALPPFILVSVGLRGHMMISKTAWRHLPSDSRTCPHKNKSELK